MKRDILQWSIFGLFIRLLIMPFSFHGHDIFFIYYPPYKFVEEGIWNPYVYLKSTFPDIYNPYYPPAVFLIFSFFIFLLRPLLPELPALFSSFELWNFTWEGNTVHFADILSNHQLFRALFAFKLPLLLFDFGIGWFLYQLLKHDSKKSLLSYKIWMLNPFVLHSGYALGQIDLIPAFLIIAAVYCISSKRNYLAMGFLSVSVLTKIFPLLLVPFAIIIISTAFKDRVKLFLAFFIPLILICMPFYVHSPRAFMEALFFSPRGIADTRQVLFFIGYGIILLLSFFRKKEDKNVPEAIILSFFISLLLFYVFCNVTLRYFIICTPFLIYIALKNKVFWFYALLFLITLFELRTAGNSQQWGLFAALQPEFFSSIPILDSFLNVAVNVTSIHQCMYRLFCMFGICMIIHLLALYKSYFKSPFKKPGAE